MSWIWRRIGEWKKRMRNFFNPLYDVGHGRACECKECIAERMV